jgi:intein/homing endonuclease
MQNNYLAYDSKIILSNGFTIDIGEIVENKLSLEVLTYSQKTKKHESAEIIDWFKFSDTIKLIRLLYNKSLLICNSNCKIYVSGTFQKQNGMFQYDFFSEENRWIEASQVREDFYLKQYAGNTILCDRVEMLRNKNTIIYGIVVENNHNFYANGILVHDNINIYGG